MKPTRPNCTDCGCKLTEKDWWIQHWDKIKKTQRVLCRKCYDVVKEKQYGR